MRSVPISHSITGPLARSIGPGFTGAERGKALTNAGGPSGPPFGVHYRKKKLPASADLKRPLIEPSNSHLSIRRQCELMGLNRSSYYLSPATESEENLRLMRLIDQQFLRTPFYGSRRMTASVGAFRGDGQSQAGSAAHGIDGPGRDLPQAADHCGGVRRTGLPL